MFRAKPIVSDDIEDWIYACFDWFDARFPPPEAPFLPTRAFFSATKGSGEETARQVLADVQRLMQVADPVEIYPLNTLPAEYRIDPNALSSTAGTFQQVEGRNVIHYDPENLKQPLLFINLLAHELMHARLAGLEDQVPGGYKAHELATDLGCIIAGFGVFQLQGADDAGWFGYMTQPSRAFALAVFLQRRGLDQSSVAPFLSRRCAKLLTRGFRHIQA